jgi:hypothetical protein
MTENIDLIMIYNIYLKNFSVLSIFNVIEGKTNFYYAV